MKLLSTAFGVLLAISTLAQDDQIADGNFHLDKEYTVSPTGTIDLSLSDAKVYITGATTETAHVRIDREVERRGITFGQEEFSIDVNNSDGNLRIRERSYSRNSGIIGYYYERYEVKIDVPEGVSLIVKGDDGDFFIKNVNGSIEIDVDDADVDLVSCRGTRFRFKLDDGDLSMDRGRGSLDIDIDDGDVNIRNASFKEVIANLDDGDLVIETSLVENGDYRIYAQDGLVSMTILEGGGEFSIRHDDGRVVTDSDFEVIQKTENFMKVSLNSGSAKVNIKADDARVRLFKD
ncbi:MAG: DUF4097 family beta strand repeat-containing protein [Cyclobacteriaceae bacterium]